LLSPANASFKQVSVLVPFTDFAMFTSPLLKIYCTAFTAQKQPVRPLPLPHIHLCSTRTLGKESYR
jgi:hypothetical protein